jgi:ATP-binding cassette subfamily B protein
MLCLAIEGDDFSASVQIPERGTMSLSFFQGGSPTARLTKPVRGRIVLACGLQAISAAAGVVPFIAVAELGRVLLAQGSELPLEAWRIAGIAVAALFIQLIFRLAAGALTHLADLDLQLHLRQEMADRLSRVPLGWFDARRSGVVKKVLQDDVAALHHLIGHSYTDMVSAVITPLAAFAYLASTSLPLLLVISIPLLIGTLLYSLQFRGFAEKAAESDKALEDVNTAAVEFVQGIAVVKTFGQAQNAFSRFKNSTRSFISFYTQWMNSIMGLALASETVLSPLCSLIMVLAAGLLMVGAGMAAPLDVVPFAVLAPGLTSPLTTMSYAYNDMMLAQNAAARICNVLDTPLLPQVDAGPEPGNARVVFEGVRFSYDEKDEVLDGVDLVLEPGTVTALVGPSGSGKSTLARLLPRFWDVQGGRILIGGIDVREMTPAALYGTVGFVFQQVQLIRASMAENIALGRPDAGLEEIEAAARAAQIHERILDLPNGYDSLAGQDVQLSGGEAQRISIARALLADAPILVLDEATAFADPKSEAAIQDALSRLIAGRTLLVIAHRLHTIVGVDQICVMNEGRIVERGTHDELLTREGLYAALWTASEAAAKGHEGEGR